jgi:hypothetical protein
VEDAAQRAQKDEVGKRKSEDEPDVVECNFKRGEKKGENKLENINEK